MSRDLISRVTRRAFQEWLVDWTLRTIEELFENHNVKCVALPEDKIPTGQRRSLVECYYASIDWGNPQDSRKILNAYEDILIQAPSQYEERKQKLIRYLERDGYKYENGRITSNTLDALFIETIPNTGLNAEHLYVYIDRINASIETDPSLAIGSTKELIEATLKTILNGYKEDYDEKKDDIPKLLKQVQKLLELAPEEVDNAKKGADIIKKILNNLSSVAVGIAELRNLYGSGHGRGQQPKGLTARHAKLVVGAGTTLCSFLLKTYEYRDNIKP